MQRRRATRALPALALATLISGCAGSLPPLPEWEPIPQPEPDQVESVLFFLGDPGRSTFERAPVIEEVERELETWSERLARDSAVAIVYLGDLVYPAGLHPPGSPEYPTDSLYVMAEIDVVNGPAARDHASIAYFLAGNHDWGEARGIEGVERLRNLEEFLERARERWGVHLALLPPAGEPGPVVVDIGDRVRMLMIDTAWWLLAGQSERKPEVVEGIERAIAEADGRTVILAAHHPWQTAGPHGASIRFWDAFGLRWFLNRTGSLLQDIDSRPMQDLRRRLEDVFARVGRPTIFVAGHDHSLQAIRGPGATDPEWTLVSGTGIKVTRVGHLPGMQFRAARAGYMTLFTMRDGSMILRVRGAPEEWVACPNEQHPDEETCMTAAREAFELLYSTYIRR